MRGLYEKTCKNLIISNSFLFYLFLGTAFSKLSYKEYVIALLLPDEYVVEAQKLNDKISRKLSCQNLTNRFHITLYQGRFSESQIQEIFKKLSANNFIPPRITMESKIKYEEKKYINWNVVENKELNNLHYEVLRIAAPYHQGALKRTIDNYQKFDLNKQKQIDEYGVNAVLSDYKPHVTLFYLPSEDLRVESAIRDVDLSIINNGEVLANNLVIGETGYDGNLTNIVNQLDLSKKASPQS